jgi:hypothetical protein
MSLLQRLRFETVSSLAFLFEVFKAVPQWGNTTIRRKIHESCDERPTQPRRASQGNLIFAIRFQGQQSRCFPRVRALLQICRPQKFDGQLHIHGFDIPRLLRPSRFVMPCRLHTVRTKGGPSPSEPSLS